MTTANKITIVRILLVPFFIVLAHYYVTTGDEIFRIGAILLFAVAAVSDGIDGYIARRYNQRSELGAILDPLADKSLLLSAIIILSLNTHKHLSKIPPWLTATILSRDAILIIGLILIHYTFGKMKVRPRAVGKVATVFQMAVVVWILMKWDVYNPQVLFWLQIAAAVLTGVSGLVYVWDGVHRLSASPSSAPAKDWEA